MIQTETGEQKFGYRGMEELGLLLAPGPKDNQVIIFKMESHLPCKSLPVVTNLGRWLVVWITAGRICDFPKVSW